MSENILTHISEYLARILRILWHEYLKSNSTLIVVDDDESIHQIWNSRIKSINSKNNTIKILHFSSPPELINWINDNSIINVKFLIDYEYIGDQENGLDLIENMKI